MGKLFDGEMMILREIPTEGRLSPRAYAVWTDTEGRVQMGPVRLRRLRGALERQDGDSLSAYVYSCSPFPGSWTDVPEGRILRVRHLGAMSLHTMACVCRGTEYDTPCPAPDCRTVQRV